MEKGLYTKYFVLKLDGSDQAVVPALLAYADATPNRVLAKDLFKLVAKIQREKR